MRSSDIYYELCEHAFDLIQSVLPDSRFQYVNAAWLEKLGYTRADVDGLKLSDVIHPDKWPELRDVVSDVGMGAPAIHVETDFVSKEGRRIGVEGRVARRVDANGVIATLCAFQDITGTKDAEEELDRLFVLSLDLLCVAGTDGYFKHINPAFRRVLGYTQEELLSKSFLEFVHPEDVDSTLAEVVRLAEGQPVVDFENRYLAEDGNYRWLA
ncbi:MAG: PAS domain S-box protein, partial [Rhodothermales bacterium]|nr:PAS domain S-box protein [Rhodothermales bacterium]